MREFMKIVEGFGTYTEIEFVCINPENGGSDPAKVKTLYKMLSKLPGLVLMRQDFMEEAGHLAFVAIIVESGEVSERDVVAAAKRAGVAIDTTRQIDDRILDQIYDGSYPDMIDMLATSTGFTCRGRSWSDHHATSKVVESAETITVYHGTCAANAASLCENGWAPNSGAVGGNQGQARYLYLSTGVEDAEWFANEKGCTTVLAVTVPMAYLIVDPEDGIGDTLEDEINNHMGLPGKVALTRPVGPESFKVVKP